MSAFTLSEKELFIAQSELQSLNNVNENKFESDVWNFEFNGYPLEVNFRALVDDRKAAIDYFSINQVSPIVFAKICFIELSDEEYNFSTFRLNMSIVFMLIEYIRANRINELDQFEIEEFIKYFTMNTFSNEKISQRLTPRNISDSRRAICNLSKINSIAIGHHMGRLLRFSLSEAKTKQVLSEVIKTCSDDSLTYSEWAKGGSFNFLTLDYGRYYIEYCDTVFGEHCEKAIALASVINRMEEHLSHVGLTLHKNTKHICLGILSGENVFDSQKYKKYKREKIENLIAALERDYKNLIAKQTRKRSLLSSKSVIEIGNASGFLIFQADNINKLREKRAEILEIERLTEIVKLYLRDPSDAIIDKLLAQSNRKVSKEKLEQAINAVTIESDSVTLPDKLFFESVGCAASEGDDYGKKPSVVNFIKMVQNAGITSVVAITGWRGSEFGFPMDAISRSVNTDFLDQYTIPVRYTINWYVFKTNGHALTAREISKSTFEKIIKLADINGSGVNLPATYAVDKRASEPHSKDTSHNAVSRAVFHNWSNFIKEYKPFKILSENDELITLEKRSTNEVLSHDDFVRLRELQKQAQTDDWMRAVQDKNLIETRKRVMDEYDRVMLIKTRSGEFRKETNWLEEYHNYLNGNTCNLPEKHIQICENCLSQRTKETIKQNLTFPVSKVFMQQIASEILDDCIYPTPHALRHIWAEAVYRRFDGDAGWFIRSQFKHVSKSMWLSYIKDKSNRQIHDKIQYKVASSIVKNWIIKHGAKSGGRFHRFLSKLISITKFTNLKGLDDFVEQFLRKDLLSIKANPWGFCFARKSSRRLSKCFDGFNINPHLAKPSLCIDCSNHLMSESNIEYIYFDAVQHLELLSVDNVRDFPKPIVKASLRYVTKALKRIREISPNHEVIPEFQEAITKYMS